MELKCVIAAATAFAAPGSLSLKPETSRKLLRWRADRCACQRHEREYLGGHSSCCPCRGKRKVPQSFIVWTWKEIIRHTDRYNPAKSSMAQLSHVAERKKSWILWSVVCHRPPLLFALPSKERAALRSWSSFLLCYCSGVLADSDIRNDYTSILFGN